MRNGCPGKQISEPDERPVHLAAKPGG
jgi:hypothetical protein